MEIREWIAFLSGLDGVTGFERAAAEEIKEKIKDLFDRVEIDNLGTLTAIKHGYGENPKKILIDAHIDRIGLIVTDIDDGGFVSFSALGGVDPRTLPASEVYILGKERIYGIIGAKPPHILTAEEREKGVKIADMLIDTGMRGEELRKKISIGDPIVIKADLLPLMGNDVTAGGLDNRSGAAAVLCAAESIISKGCENDIYVKLTAGEELGLHGAYASSRGESYDLVITVDTTFGSSPDCGKFESFKSGCGAVICTGPNLHPGYTKKLMALASENAISYETEVCGGSSGTNAWAYQNSSGAVPCVLISIPLRAMHTSAEAMCLDDAEAVQKLIYFALKDGDFLA